MNTEGQNYRLTMANMPVFNTPKVTVTTKVVMPVMPASRNAASTAKHESHSASQNVIRKNDPKPIPEYDVRALVGPVKKNRTPFLVAAITASIIILASASVLYFRNKNTNKIGLIGSAYNISE